MNAPRLLSLVALLAHGAWCQRPMGSNIDALLEIVSEKQIVDILKGERLDLENCFSVTKDVKTCMAVTRTFIGGYEWNLRRQPNLARVISWWDKRGAENRNVQHALSGEVLLLSNIKYVSLPLLVIWYAPTDSPDMDCRRNQYRSRRLEDRYRRCM